MNNAQWQEYDESTWLSWLWAFLFGPIYFAWHGFWGKAALIFILNWMIIGFILAPFLAYPAWKQKAMDRADKERLIGALENRAA